MVARHGWRCPHNPSGVAVSLIVGDRRNDSCRQIERESDNIAVILPSRVPCGRGAMPHPALPSATVEQRVFHTSRLLPHCSEWHAKCFMTEG